MASTMSPEFVRDLDCASKGAASQKLWKVGDGYVITSAANVIFSGPETYVFQADADGEVTNWCELKGSFRGALDHDRAIAGYCGGE